MVLLAGLIARPLRDLAAAAGAQIAVAYALARPDRVRALTVLDPTRVFASMRITTALRAVPVMAAPSSRRARASGGPARHPLRQGTDPTANAPT